MSRHVFILLVSCLTLLIASSGFATDFYVNGATGHDSYDGLAPEWNGVSGPKATIQAGIDAASDSDTVTVADGTYTGDGNRDLDFGGKAITLRSAHGAATCIIDCQATETDFHRGFSFESGEGPDSIVDGFTIGNGLDGYNGGAVFCNGSSPTISDCTITGSLSTNGGGISCWYSSATIADCTISHNRASAGGAVFCWESIPTISDCTITDNVATDGGGIYCLRSSPAITNCMITRNCGWGSGVGSMNLSESSATVTNCIITDNSGWGITASSSSSVIIRCVIAGNSGGIYCSGANATVIGCMINDNGGGGIRCSGTSFTVVSCTIHDNGSIYAGGLSAYSGSDGTLRNSIVWGNTGGRAGELYISDSSLVVRYCDIDGGAAGAYVSESDGTLDYDVTNIEADPLLRPDCHLLADSPCIDYCSDAPNSDVDGETRPVDIPGMGFNGERMFDIGADEFVDTDGDGMPDWWELAHFGSPTAARPWGDPDHDCVRNIHEYEQALHPFDSDTDGDGRRDGRELRTGTNPRHPDNAQKTYHVNGTTGDDSWDGLAPSYDGTHGPKRTIQAGIDATVTGYGYTVLVADGTYTGEGNRDLDFEGRAITLRSAHGAEACIIDCQGTEADPHRSFWFDSGEGADSIVDGFTSRNGYGDRGGGVFGQYSSPTITNCTITGNCSGYDGGGILCRDGSPTITNCTITGNSSGFDGGGIYCRDGDPTIVSCTVTGNSSDFEGSGIYCRDGDPTITNCTVTGNSSGFIGGGILCWDSSPTIGSCTITGNCSGFYGGGIYCRGGSSTITDCTITCNAAGSGGGGVECAKSDLTMINCTIADNSSDTSGGGLLCVGGGDAMMSNCTITRNSSGFYGGGIDLLGGEATITNCAITGNSSGFYGGGIMSSGSDAMVTNCTIAGNSASWRGGGVDCGGSATIRNSVLWGNTAPQGNQLASHGSVLIVRYCDVEGGAAEAYVFPGCTLDMDGSNIDADPLFVDAAGGDYRLRYGSPCIDAGTSDDAPERDIRGAPRWDVPRIANTGGGDKPWYDIGAYEFYFGKRWGHLWPHPPKGHKHHWPFWHRFGHGHGKGSHHAKAPKRIGWHE